MPASRKTNSLSRLELGTLLILFGGLASASMLWPWSQTWLLLLWVVGAPALLVVLLPLWSLWSVWRGLRFRTAASWQVDIMDVGLVVTRGSKSITLALADLAAARLARNANWTESKLVEDALTLWDRQGRQLIRLPASAKGLSTLIEWLDGKTIPFERVEVEAPTLFD